jgi:nucleoside-diphosphate-sugar epimerase
MIIGLTGATGGFGKRLTELLIAKGLTVRVLARPTSKIDDLVNWGAEIMFGDINQPETLVSFIAGLNICYHIAAQVTTAPNEELRRVNEEGTRNICETIIRHNQECRLVYCSSIVAKNVHFYNRLFQSDYTMSKYRATRIVKNFIKRKLIRASIIYPGYIYGPYDKNFLPTLIKILQQGLPFMIHGGEKNAPIIYSDDLCELFHLAGTKKIAIGKEYVSLRRSEIGIHGFLKILAQKTQCSYPNMVLPKLPLVLAAFIAKLLNLKLANKLNMRVIGGLSNHATYFNDAAKQDLGWDHKVSIQEGIDKALSYHRL